MADQARRKPHEEATPGDRPPPDGLVQLTQDVLQLFMQRIADGVARTGVSAIDTHTLQQIADNFARGDDPILRKTLSRGWTRLEAEAEQAFWARMRKYPLERLIVSRFEDRLTPRDAAPIAGRNLSRRVIPATIAALHQMVGPDLFDEYERRARDLAESVRALEGDGAAWKTLYRHPQADALVNDILVYIARYFTDAPKRRQWMVGFMDRNLPSTKTDAERAWRFGDAEFHLLIGGLYAALKAQLADPAHRARHVKRYGAETVLMVEETLAALEHDRRQVAGAQDRTPG